MLGSSRRWSRFVRLLVACVAFFVARPVGAARIIDGTVLVAELRPRHVATAAPDRPSAAPAPPVRRASPRSDAERPTFAPPPVIARDCADLGPLIRVPEKYLRNCSLLR